MWIGNGYKHAHSHNCLYNLKYNINAIINLLYTAGFTDSCDDHTRETGDEETEMAVLTLLSEGTAVDKSLLVEGGNHYHRKQTSKKNVGKHST